MAFLTAEAEMPNARAAVVKLSFSAACMKALSWGETIHQKIQDTAGNAASGSQRSSRCFLSLEASWNMSGAGGTISY
jgi:hypothetical protein